MKASSVGITAFVTTLLVVLALTQHVSFSPTAVADSAPASAPAGSQATTQPAQSAANRPAGAAGYAWQRTDKYLPPDFEGFFPDDPAAGKRLDQAFAAGMDTMGAKEILALVQQGLRNSGRRNEIVRYVGNRYMRAQDPLTVEILYHASQPDDKYGTRYNGMYFGLSMVNHKTPNVLRTLVDCCLADPNDVGTVKSGCEKQSKDSPKGQLDELRQYLQPYLASSDEKTREMALLLDRHFKGEIVIGAYLSAQKVQQAKIEWTPRFEEMKRQLSGDDAKTRDEVLKTIQRTGGLLGALDDSFIDAFAAAAAKGNGDTKRGIAELVGRWVWCTPPQNPKAVQLMLELSRDKTALDMAVYNGLSLANPKSDEIVARLVELAATGQGDMQRIVWGLGSGTDKARVEALITPYLDQYATNPDVAVQAYVFYRRFFAQEPPAAERFAKLGRFVILCGPMPPYKPTSQNEFRAKVAQCLPSDLPVELMVISSSGYLGIAILVQGAEADKVVRRSLEQSGSLFAGKELRLATPKLLNSIGGRPAATQPAAN